MKYLKIAAAAACLFAGPAGAAHLINFDGGDLTGGGLFYLNANAQAVDDPSIVTGPASGKVLYQPGRGDIGLAAIFFDRLSPMSGGGRLVVTSFDICPITDTTLRLVAYQDLPTVKQAFAFSLAGGAWTTIDQDFSLGIASMGDIRADGGFYVDNVAWEYQASSPNPPQDPPEWPTGVPEPSAWSLMIGGFGLSGAALRRRRAAI